MRTSNDGIEFLKDEEGVEYKMYHDQAGLPTIGVGHKLTKSELMSGKIQLNDRTVKWNAPDGLTDTEIESLLRIDLAEAETAVNRLVLVRLTQGQFDALVSFVFNVGWTAFSNSTLLFKLNTGDYSAVPAQMRRWVYSSGKQLAVLASRREREIQLWLR